MLRCHPSMQRLQPVVLHTRRTTVHEDEFHRAIGLLGEGKGLDVVLFLRQVELAARGLAARLLDLRHDLLHRRHGARGQHDLGALRCEVARRLLAEACQPSLSLAAAEATRSPVASEARGEEFVPREAPVIITTLPLMSTSMAGSESTTLWSGPAGAP